MLDEVLALDATDQARLIAAREIAPLELLEAVIDRIERLDGAVNAVTLRLFDQARATLSQGVPDGPFGGVPFLIKDIYCHVKDTVTSNGARVFRDNLIDHDSELTARYRRAGLVIAGKTNVPEMASVGTTESTYLGPARNPWSLAHTPGGSSGGASAAVAAGYVAAAHANDGAGSTRIPAACCGLFGLKPSRGRITLGPDVGEAIGGITAEHVVSWSVRDSAALLDATQGPSPGDPYAAPPAGQSFLAAMAERGRPLRVAVCDTALFATVLDPACRQAVQDAAILFGDLGHRVEWAAPRIDGEAFRRSLSAFWPMTVTRTLTAAARARGVDPDRLAEELEPLNQHLYSLGRDRRAVDYLQDLVFFQGMTRAFGRFFQDWDILLTPTLTFPPPKLGFFDAALVGREEAWRRVIDSFAFTAPANVCGLPAASVPFAFNADGLPVGIHLTAAYGDEAVLFRLAAEIEEARPWAHTRPRLEALP